MFMFASSFMNKKMIDILRQYHLNYTFEFELLIYQLPYYITCTNS